MVKILAIKRCTANFMTCEGLSGRAAKGEPPAEVARGLGGVREGALGGANGCATRERLEAAETNFARGRHRIENACDDLRRSRAAHVVDKLPFEQLGVREDDAELIVQAVKQETET